MLVVQPDGTIMNGNTRVAVLRSRGHDVGFFPRMTYDKGNRWRMKIFWGMGQ